ncbi:MAG: 2-phosphosulfolactate phosphatase [Ktedonobacterales bacterium]
MAEIEIQWAAREAADRAQGVVLVIDVIRAFSVAAYAMAGGARAIWLVRTVEEALALRERQPDALLIGEVGGRRITGFDYDNSPSRMAEADVRGRLLIQRTGAGTQGAVAASGAAFLLPCALVNAHATAAYARQLATRTQGIITLLPTAAPVEDGDKPAIEDHVCGEYVEALLRGQLDAAEVLARGIARLHAVGRFEIFAQGYPDFPAADVAAVLAADHFAFALEGRRERWKGIEYISVQRVDMV